MMIKIFRRKNISLFVLFVLTACGGGGGGGGSSSQAVNAPVNIPPDNVPLKTPEAQTPTSADNNVKVGVLDSGVNQSLSNLAGKVSHILRYVGQGNNLGSGVYTPDDITHSPSVATTDVAGHGSYVSQILASNGDEGTYTGSQNVDLYEAQTSNDHQGHSAINDQMAAILDLHNHYGVNLFNASWGSDNHYEANSNATHVLRYLAATNGLIVFSAGNDARLDPAAESLTPLVDKTIANGLLTAVGIDDNKQLYRDLDENGQIKGSNACGRAAAWCLAGQYVTGPLREFNNNGYINFYGTSGAAPQVTAAAAEVWYKYPWMTASQVKQTLLTTADYLPDGSYSGLPYNDTFGWGELNASRAENGPALFSSLFGDFNAQVPDSQYVLGNDISGDAGLIKSGNGVLELAGNESYTGNTTVNQGTLLVSGSINGGGVTIAPQGILSGSGAVSSTHNNGTVDLSQGSLTVNGDYTQSHDGVLNAYISHQLEVNGNAELDGTVNLVNKNFVTSGNYDILHAQRVQGQFSQVNGSKFLTVDRVTYAADNVNFDVTQISAQDAVGAGDALSQAGARVVDSMFSAANAVAQRQQNGAMLTANEQQLLDYTANLQSSTSGDAVQHIVDSHSAVIYAELPSVLLAEQNRLTQTVANRLSAMDGMEEATPGVWTSHDYMKNQYHPDGWNKVTSTTNNTSLGMDGRVSHALLLGGFINKNEMNVTLDRNGGSLKGKQDGFGAYAQYDAASFYINGLASYQRGNADIKRPVMSNGSQSTEKSNTDISSSTLYLESGYTFELPHEVDVTPYASVEYDRSRTDGVDEDNLPGVNVSGMKGEQSSVALGSRANYLVSDALRVGAWAQVSKVVSRNISDMTLATNLSGQNISLDSPEFDRNSFDYGLNINYILLNSVQIFAGMQSSTANEQALSASAGLKYYW